MAWNPRYVAYATAHGRDPDAQLEHDREAWPGGAMCGFVLWIGERWTAWRREHGRRQWEPLSAADHESFDRSIGVPPCTG